MQLKKIVTVAGAALGASALALAPTAANAAVSSLSVTGTTASGSLVGSASVTMPVYGSPMTLACTGGSATGAWNTAAPATAPLTFSALSLACNSFLPGTTVSMAVNSPLTFVPAASNTPTSAATDVVTGKVTGAATAVRVTVSGGCTLYVGGDQPASFNEATGELSLNGAGFKVASSPAPTLGCLGAVAGGDQLTMNTVKFSLTGGANFA